MKTITKIFKKVAGHAGKAVFLGSLVGCISMLSYASEKTEGPTIERAQLETVDIDLHAVVAAITKVDPSWVKGLPRLTQAKIAVNVHGMPTTTLEPDWFIYDGVGDLDNPESYDPYTGQPSELCTEGADLCAVRVTPGTDPTHPDEEELVGMQDAIEQAIAFDSYDPNQIRKRTD